MKITCQKLDLMETINVQVGWVRGRRI